MVEEWRQGARRLPQAARGRRVKAEPADEIADVVKTLGHVAEYWLSDPQRAVEVQASLGKAYLELWAAAVKRMAGEPAPPVVEPDPRDKRFADPEWSSNQFYDFLKQAYLLTTQWADRLVQNAAVDEHTRRKAEFYVRQIGNAIAPSELRAHQSRADARDAVVECREPGARHAHAGRGHRGRPGQPEDPPVRCVQVRGRQEPRAHARQGDLPERADAADPVCPATETVLRRPLLIIPPWINKFYILDLNPEKSFIKWCVDQGLTVFVISWVNPDAQLAMKSFEDYMREGPLARST
jgi:polyhydroxyalkanoate synthase